MTLCMWHISLECTIFLIYAYIKTPLDVFAATSNIEMGMMTAIINNNNNFCIEKASSAPHTHPYQPLNFYRSVSNVKKKWSEYI